MHGLKQCKNDPNHVYFTSKGCGLCSIESKFNKDLSVIKKQKSDPEKIRGIEVSRLSTEKVREEKEQQHEHDVKMQRIFYAAAGGYLLFFALFYKMLLPVSDVLQKVGLGTQFLALIGILAGINKLLKKGAARFRPLKNKVVSDMFLVYALIWILITLVLVNDLPRNLFELAPDVSQ